MKKQGFTVLETIISLFIIMTLFSSAVSIGSVETNIYKDIESEGFMYEMHDFLTYAKLRSRIENKPGKLLTIPSENKIYYAYGSSGTAKYITAPGSMEMTSMGTSIPIDSSGRINKAGSIEFQNSFKELKSIKIRVGVDYINLNDRQ